MKNINFTSVINSSGYGTASLNILLSLQRLGVEVSLFPIGPIEAPPEHHQAIQKALDRARNSYDPTAPSVRLFHQFDLAQHVGRGPHVGFPIFELDRLTSQEAHQLSCQDAICVPSRWARGVLEREERLSGLPIFAVPLGVDTTVFSETPAAPGGAETVFLNVGKYEVRKGHTELLQAFEMAFSPKDSARLIIHGHNPFVPPKHNPEIYNQQWQRFFTSSPMYAAGKLEVSIGRMNTQKDVAALMGRADCGVFPARAEGWNLELLEMMAMGKHVIATDYSAHTEFCTSENALLIPVEALEDAHDGVWFHGKGKWAKLGKGQVKKMAEYMRAVHERKQKGALGVNQEGVQTGKEFSWENSARKLLSALESLSNG